MKAVVAKAILAFQTTEEYNTILLQWYFKGFELLRRYLLKHGPGTNLEDLDFEAVDKEIEADEAAQAVQPSGEEPSVADKVGDKAPPSWLSYILEDIPLHFFFFALFVFFGLLSVQFSRYILVFQNNLHFFKYALL